MAKVINGFNALQKLRQKISQDLEEDLRKEVKAIAPIREILFKSFATPTVKEDDSTLLVRCSKLDPKARKKVLALIYLRLCSYDLKVRTLDAVLSQYYINYYGEPSGLTSSNQRIGLTKIKKLLIPKDSEYEVKLRKVAQVIYQESYGMTIVDELIYMQPESKADPKIEEIGCFAPDCFWFKVSGVDVKLDKVCVKERDLQPVVDRLSSCAPNFTLNSANPSVSTDSLNGDRVSITCPPYSRYYEFNIRRHYPNTLTTDFLLEIGSTTKAFEKWLDDLMECYPRLAISGDQAAGKTTLLRRIAARYPSGTVVGTIESSFELELQKIPHLIVKQLRAINVEPEKALEDSLRFGLSIMINGETRSGKEAATALQAGQRSSKGTITTSHAPSAWDFIRMIVQLLIRDNIFTNERSALYYVISNIDIIIVPAVDNVGDEATGVRYIDSVWEIPSMLEKDIDNFEPRLIFKAEKVREGYYPLKFVQPLSSSTIEFFKGRNPSFNVVERMNRLESYNYDFENSK